eukprot:5586294-Prymnesium_polylepis.1
MSVASSRSTPHDSHGGGGGGDDCGGSVGSGGSGGGGDGGNGGGGGGGGCGADTSRICVPGGHAALGTPATHGDRLALRPQLWEYAAARARHSCTLATRSSTKRWLRRGCCRQGPSKWTTQGHVPRPTVVAGILNKDRVCVCMRFDET